MSEQPLSSLAVYSARPTIHVDEQEYPKVGELIVSMEMQESEGGLSALELRVSNVACLRRLRARFDGDLPVVGKELHVSPRRDVERGTITLALYSQLREARVVADLSYQATEVTVGGWDAAQGQRVTGRSAGANL